MGVFRRANSWRLGGKVAGKMVRLYAWRRLSCRLYWQDRSGGRLLVQTGRTDNPFRPKKLIRDDPYQHVCHGRFSYTVKH